MKFFLFKIFVLSILLFFIYLKIILIKDELNKPFTKENKITLPKSISSTFIKFVYFHSQSVIGHLNYNIKSNIVLIFEPASYHQECTPGYTKYFLDL